MEENEVKKRLFDIHERDFASRVPGGQQTVASGSKMEKRDVVTSRDAGFFRFMYELKCSQRKSYSFKLEDWNQLKEDVLARSPGMRPAYGIRFYGPEKAMVEETTVLADLVVMELDDFIELYTELWSLREELVKTIPPTI